MFFRFCRSCNQPDLPSWLITAALLFIGAFAIMLLVMVISTFFG